jgi:hypothetical protein
MCPGVDSASENEYQVNPGGKGGRCVRMTAYHLHVSMSRNLGALTSWNPLGHSRPVTGLLYFYQKEQSVKFIVPWLISFPVTVNSTHVFMLEREKCLQNIYVLFLHLFQFILFYSYVDI